MTVRIYEHNLKEGLALPNAMRPIIEEIQGANADVLVLPDAYSLEQTKHGARREVLDEGMAALRALGYDTEVVEYDDGWHHDRNLVVASRLPWAVKTVRWGSRQSADMHIVDPRTTTPLRVVAGHGRDDSKADRLLHVAGFLETVDPDGDEPTVWVADDNEMHSKDRIARLLGSRVVRACAQHAIPPVGGWLRRKRSLAIRTVDMADGESVAKLEDARFRDADPDHRPTLHGVLQVDRFMLRHASAPKGVEHGERCSSDHVSLVADIES